MRQLIRRVWYAIRQRRFEANLAEEMEFHRAMKERELEAGGLEPVEATFATRRALGSLAWAQDRSRDVWCPHWLQGVVQDLRLAVRVLRATPIVTIVAVLSLALGIGANTAIFSLVNALLLRALPVKDPGQLVLVSNGPFAGGQAWGYRFWQLISQQTQLFDGAAAWSAARFNLASGGETQFIEGVWADGSFFKILGVPAVLGRTFTDADDARGGGPDGPVAVISYGFWQRHFGGAPDAIHRTVTLDHLPFAIVGVTPPNFFGADVGRAFDVIVPLGVEPVLHGREASLDRDDYWLTVVARLKPGQTFDVATAALRAVQPKLRQALLPANMRAEYLELYLTAPLTLVPAATGTSILRGRYERALMTIMVVVALVLLIACANIANLLLARATTKRHELSMRVALGASRWRLVRQLLMETAVLAAASTVVGVLVAAWGSQLLVRQLSTRADTVFLDLSLDWRVLTFTIAVASATALLFGTAPALSASSVKPMVALKERGPNTSGIRRGLGEDGLVVAQVAVSLILVVAAGLFVRTFSSLATRKLGFERDRTLLIDVDARRVTVDPAQRVPMYDRVLEAVRALPSVSDAAVSMVTPVAGHAFALRVEVSGGGPIADGEHRANALTNAVSPGWFSTFGIPLASGRDFTDGDRQGAPRVAIVNQALARQPFNGASPLGHSITLTTPGRVVPMEIVGVVTDAVYLSLRETVHPTVYIPLAQFYLSPANLATVTLSVRATRGSPVLLAKSVEESIRMVNPDLALTLQPLAEQVNASLTQERVVAMLSGFFGALALLLAGLGLYGVTAYAVTRRRSEIGIRMALGAAPAGVVRLVLSRVFALVALGVLIGGAVSLWASRFVATLLFGVEPRDPATLVGAAIVLAAVAAVAAWLPAYRASRIDPAEVLRCE